MKVKNLMCATKALQNAFRNFLQAGTIIIYNAN